MLKFQNRATPLIWHDCVVSVLLCSLPLLTSGGCGVSEAFSDGLVPSVHQKPGNYPLSFDIIDDTGEARIKFRT